MEPPAAWSKMIVFDKTLWDVSVHGFSPSTTLTGRAKSTTSPSTDLIYTAGETCIGVPTRLYTDRMHFQIPPHLTHLQIWYMKF